MASWGLVVCDIELIAIMMAISTFPESEDSASHPRLCYGSNDIAKPLKSNTHLQGHLNASQKQGRVSVYPVQVPHHSQRRVFYLQKSCLDL